MLARVRAIAKGTPAGRYRTENGREVKTLSPSRNHCVDFLRYTRNSSDVSQGLIAVMNYMSRHCYIIGFVTEKRLLK
jgi:hypothetical protein